MLVCSGSASARRSPWNRSGRPASPPRPSQAPPAPPAPPGRRSEARQPAPHPTVPCRAPCTARTTSSRAVSPTPRRRAPRRLAGCPQPPPRHATPRPDDGLGIHRHRSAGRSTTECHQAADEGLKSGRLEVTAHWYQLVLDGHRGLRHAQSAPSRQGRSAGVWTLPSRKNRNLEPTGGRRSKK